MRKIVAGGAAGLGDGHLEDGGDAAGGGGARLGGEVAALGIGGRATVEVDVDGAGQQQFAGGVDGLGGADAAGVGGQEGDFAGADADIEGGDIRFRVRPAALVIRVSTLHSLPPFLLRWFSTKGTKSQSLCYGLSATKADADK